MQKSEANVAEIWGDEKEVDHRKSKCNCIGQHSKGIWCSDMILTLSVSGLKFNSQNVPSNMLNIFVGKPKTFPPQKLNNENIAYYKNQTNTRFKPTRK